MMQTLLTHKLKEKNIPAIVESAGVAEKDPTPASDNARAVMKERNLSLDEHKSRHIRTTDLASYDYILVVDQKTKDAVVVQGVLPEKVIILNEENGGVPNPYGGDITAYRECANTLEKLTDAFAEQIA